MTLRITRPPAGNRRLATGALRTSRAWCMRFDKPPAPPSSTRSSNTNGSASPPQVAYRALPASMYPKAVGADFTPFPLPKHDASLGFGAVRLRNVPDIEEAKGRMAASPSTTAAAYRAPQLHRSRATQLMEEASGGDDSGAAASLLWAELSEGGAAAAPSPSTVVGADLERPAAASVAGAPEPASDLGGYHVHPRLPLLDILECGRSVEDLLAQFWNRPQHEARTATVLDFAATLQRRSNAELTRILYELSSLFAWDGNGVQFVVVNVTKFGRGYTVTSELTKAFVRLVDAMTVAFVEEQPQRLAESPALLAQVLHFLALVKIMEPNKWFTLNPNAPQNRADYSHPAGVNRTVAYQETGRRLVDFLEDLVASEDEPASLDGTSDHPAAADWAPTPLTAAWTADDVLDVLAGFSGLMPDGKAASRVVAALLDALWVRWANVGFALTEPQQAAQLERLYMLLQVMDTQRDAVLDALLGGQLRAHDEAVDGTAKARRLFREHEDTPPLSLAPSLTHTRGPDFFSAVSQDRRGVVKTAAVRLLQASLAAAREAGDEALLRALVESGTELLQSLRSKTTAVSLARAEGFDTAVLAAVPHMAEVAARLAAQQHQQPHQRQTAAPFLPLTTEAGGLPDTPALLAHLRANPAPYLLMHNGRRVHPVRTLVTGLDHVAAVENVFVLHSSGVERYVDGLVAVARRLRNGKDVLIVTSSCLRALQVAAQHATSDKTRTAADRALQVASYELEAGRAVLVPLTEELYLHDAGTFCDEDLMLWTLAAYLARDLPLVKVHTIMGSRSRARNPQHMMRAEHSPLTSSGDLYNRATPLLQALRSKTLRSVTHHPAIKRPVRDRPPSLYKVNPIRARFVYRRDKALFDKYHVTARNLAPGFSQGALDSDMRGLGVYTPDHPQVPYAPVEELKCRPVRSN